MSLKERDGDQPLPTVNDEPDIQTQVIADIEARRAVGIQRYGTALQPWNGRDALRDLYEELLDGATYIKQVMVERRKPLEGIWEAHDFQCDCDAEDPCRIAMALVLSERTH